MPAETPGEHATRDLEAAAVLSDLFALQPLQPPPLVTPLQSDLCEPPNFLSRGLTDLAADLFWGARYIYFAIASLWHELNLLRNTCSPS